MPPQVLLVQIDLLRRVVLLAARRTLATIEAGYDQGRFTVLEILDAYQKVADAELMEHDALASLHTALATIEGLIGSSAVQAQARDQMKRFVEYARGRRCCLSPRSARKGLAYVRGRRRGRRKPSAPKADAEKGHGHEDTVKLSDAQVAAAGIELADRRSARAAARSLSP